MIVKDKGSECPMKYLGMIDFHLRVDTIIWLAT